jgi:ribonuclease D
VSRIPLELIDAPDRFEVLLGRLRTEKIVGIDTEAASFHRYHDRIYLLQVSSPTTTAIVDPLATGGLEAAGTWLSSGQTEFVFHDADYDLRLLRQEYRFQVARLFDTRVAAQFLNEPSIGLAALLETRFGVRTDKRYQRADWSTRPLAPEMLEYAATDTHYLIPLAEAFREALPKIGRLAWVEEECELLTKVEWASAETTTDGFLRIKGARQLDRRGLAVLRELHRWREETSNRLDRAPFRVMGNEALTSLALRQPRSMAQLEKIPGVGRDTVTRRGTEVLAAIERGLATPHDQLPEFPRHPRIRPDHAFESRVEKLKAWRKGLSDRLALPAGLVAPNALLEAIARKQPRSEVDLAAVPGIRRWQVGEFGPEILATLEPKNR